MSDTPNMNDLLAQAMQMQQQLMDAQRTAAETMFEGVAGGGVVRAEVTGAMEFRRIHIDPKVIDPTDATMLEDLVLAALHDGAAKVHAAQAQTMHDIQGLGGLGGLLG